MTPLSTTDALSRTSETSATSPGSAPEWLEGVASEDVPSSERVGWAPGITPPSGRFDTTTFLSDVILGLGLADPERLEAALQAARNPGTTLEEILVETAVLGDADLARALSERYGVDHVDLETFDTDPRAGVLLSPTRARRYQALPIAMLADSTLLVAMADPGDWFAAGQIERETGLRVKAAVAARSEILAGIDRTASQVRSDGAEGAGPSLARAAVSPAVDGPEAPDARSKAARDGGDAPSDGVGADAPAAPAPRPTTPSPTAVPAPPPPAASAAEVRRWAIELRIAEREARIELARRQVELESRYLEIDRVELERTLRA